MKDKLDRKRLSRVAELVRADLQQKEEAGQIRWHSLRPSRVYTDGWCIRLGGLGRGKPFLELWFDRYPRLPHRCFWFGFYSPNRKAITGLFHRAPDYLQPVREIHTKDYEKTGRYVWQLRKKMHSSQFAKPIFEDYRQGWRYYGMFDRTPVRQKNEERLIAHRAVAFFVDVFEVLPRGPKRTVSSGIYPRTENRKFVVRHVARERDSLLAEDCKIRDKYKCRVCGMRFEAAYGELGREFAEAHHIIPLSKLKGEVRSTVDDLVTVCANCHRMLHKMDGKREDVPKLRNIVRRRKR